MEGLVIHQVLPEEYLEQLKTEPYLVGVVLKKDTQPVMKIITPYGIPSFLKRVKPSYQHDTNAILLCRQSEEQTIASIRQSLGELLKDEVVWEIPSVPCPLKEKFAQWEECWPCIVKNHVEIISHTAREKDLIQSLLEEKEYTQYLLSKSMEVLMRGKGECIKGSVLHGVILMLQEWPQSEEFNKEPEVDKSVPVMEKLEVQVSDQYYYLTGLRMLVKGELCGMCAMALVHSRLERLYSSCGDIDRVRSVCLNRNLNHNYHLFRVSK